MRGRVLDAATLDKIDMLLLHTLGFPGDAKRLFTIPNVAATRTKTLERDVKEAATFAKELFQSASCDAAAATGACWQRLVLFHPILERPFLELVFLIGPETTMKDQKDSHKNENRAFFMPCRLFDDRRREYSPRDDNQPRYKIRPEALVPVDAALATATLTFLSATGMIWSTAAESNTLSKADVIQILQQLYKP